MTADLRAFRQVGFKNNSHSSNANEDIGAPCQDWLSLLELNKCQELMPDPFDQFFQILCEEWVNNTHLPVILAMVEVFREKFAGTATFGCR
jgi:hypothetical protein